MKLVMTLLVRDEVDIVRENLEFHLARGVDHVIAIDNGSTDGTTEILEEYARAGALTLLHEPSRDYLQAHWVNRMAFMARDAMGADWIINNDADEFWRPPSPPGRPGDLKAVLAGRRGSALSCLRHNMMAPYRELDSKLWHEALVWRAARKLKLPRLRDPLKDPLRHPYFLYDLPPKVIVRARDLVEVDKGCHAAAFDPPAEPEPCDVEIYHFPIRSRTKFEASVRHIAAAVARDGSLPPETSWKYRRWGAMIAKDGHAHRAFAETLPSATRTLAYRLCGYLERDDTLQDELEALRT
ncbi:hypothetical protein CWI75_04955 [Kineobactrum sediminis]|uniref:Glycosyltransferase family 2 protein n=1 Tax=Kineobactrum sediminis TaxID=1905677 RepID=A0A2N5Y5L8_9GAMM|nr:glycosyltransferase family 2 protein [Kineobactrum sediminis]PLW83696.1 hypothetical protein CWI75_04955 [Kineobactrum sediminis]